MKQLLYILLVAVAFTACRSSKNIEKSKVPAATASANETSRVKAAQAAAALAYTQKVVSHKVNSQCISANAKVRIMGMGGKDLSANGKLQMKRDQMIRISLRMLGFEVGVMEFTPADVLVIDRFNKQYVRAAYNEVGFLRQAGLDFYSLQALFWNELFLPGQHQLTTSDLKRFTLEQVQQTNVLVPTSTPRLTYRFVTDAATETLRRLQVVGKNVGDKGEFSFNYDLFQQFGGRRFPTQLQLAVTGTGKDVSLGISLSSLKTSADFDTTGTKLSGKYTRRSAAEVLSKLGMN